MPRPCPSPTILAACIRFGRRNSRLRALPAVSASLRLCRPSLRPVARRRIAISGERTARLKLSRTRITGFCLGSQPTSFSRLHCDSRMGMTVAELEVRVIAGYTCSRVDRTFRTPIAVDIAPQSVALCTSWSCAARSRLSASYPRVDVALEQRNGVELPPRSRGT